MCWSAFLYFHFDKPRTANNWIKQQRTRKSFIDFRVDFKGTWCCLCCFIWFGVLLVFSSSPTSSLEWPKNRRRKEQNEEAERTTCISCLTLELIGSCNSLKLKLRMSAHGISLKSLSYIVNRTTCICIDCLVSPKGKWKHIVHCVYYFFKEAINCLKRQRPLGEREKKSENKEEKEKIKSNDRNLVTKRFVHFGFEMRIFIRGDHFVDALN